MSLDVHLAETIGQRLLLTCLAPKRDDSHHGVLQHQRDVGRQLWSFGVVVSVFGWFAQKFFCYMSIGPGSDIRSSYTTGDRPA